MRKTGNLPRKNQSIHKPIKIASESNGNTGDDIRGKLNYDTRNEKINNQGTIGRNKQTEWTKKNFHEKRFYINRKEKVNPENQENDRQINKTGQKDTKSVKRRERIKPTNKPIIVYSHRNI